MNPAPTLKSTAEHFATWRKNRQPGSSKITPLSLQQEALHLKSQYSSGRIVKALGINHTSLKRWSANVECTAFIPLPTEPAPDTNLSADISCELPNGIRLTFTTRALAGGLLEQLVRFNPEAIP